VSDRNRILIIEDDEGIRDGVRILIRPDSLEQSEEAARVLGWP